MRPLSSVLLALSAQYCGFGQGYIITTLAGNGTTGFGGDNGPAVKAVLNNPKDIAVDSVGNVYIAEVFNNRIRVLTPAASGPTADSPTISDVTNATSSLAGPIAPGEIVVLYGPCLGPPRFSSASVGSDGPYDNALAGTRVQSMESRRQCFTRRTPKWPSSCPTKSRAPAPRLP